MRNPNVQGLLIGAVAAAAAWLAGPSSPRGTVSTFQDVLSLLLFVLLAAIAIWGVPTWRTVNRIGLLSGLVLGLSTGLRGIVQWNRPDVLMVTLATVGSFFLVFVTTHVVAWIVFAAKRTQSRA